jgi:phosphomannomutase
MASVLDLMARRGQSIPEIVSELPPMCMIKDKIDLDSTSAISAAEAIRLNLPAPETSTLDGLRLDWPDAWLLVRGSNTEPIIRFICEAESEAKAQALIDKAKAIVARL